MNKLRREYEKEKGEQVAALLMSCECHRYIHWLESKISDLDSDFKDHLAECTGQIDNSLWSV